MSSEVITIGNAHRVLHAMQYSLASPYFSNYLDKVRSFSTKVTLEDISPLEDACLVEGTPLSTDSSSKLERSLSLDEEWRKIFEEERLTNFFRFWKRSRLGKQSSALWSESYDANRDYMATVSNMPSHVIVTKPEGRHALWITEPGYEVLNDLSYLSVNNLKDPSIWNMEVNTPEYRALVETNGKTNFEPFFVQLLERLNGLSSEAKEYAKHRSLTIGRGPTSSGMGNFWWDEANVAYDPNSGKFLFQVLSCSNGGAWLDKSEETDPEKINSLIHKFRRVYSEGRFSSKRGWKPSTREFFDYFGKQNEIVRAEIVRAFPELVG